MKFFRKVSVCAAVVLAFASDAAFSENPYAQISARNVFDLNLSAAVTPSTPPEPLPTITPNGIVSIFGNAQTLFKVTDNQPGKPAVEKSYILAEGQREDGIEVVKIDEKNSTVTFNNHGTTQQLRLQAAATSDGSLNGPYDITTDGMESGSFTGAEIARLGIVRPGVGRLGIVSSQILRQQIAASVPSPNTTSFTESQAGSQMVSISGNSVPDSNGNFLPATATGYSDRVIR